MVVGFPEKSFTMNLRGVFTDFLSDPLHPVSIIFLWLMDVVIVISCLKDERIRAGVNQWLSFILVGLVAFVVIAIIAPLANPEFASTYALVTGWLSMGSLLVARGFSYVAAQQATPI
jgi:hypothetical protein